MIIRHGFVSNSSSSSYIIALKPDAITIECPCCHRKGISIIDFIETLPRNYSSEETRLEKSSRAKILYEYYADLKTCEHNIIEYKRHNPDEVNVRSYNGQITWGQYLEWEEQDKKYIEDKIKLIESIPMDLEVIELRISYHDELVQSVLKNELNAGNITIIYDSEDNRVFE